MISLLLCHRTNLCRVLSILDLLLTIKPERRVWGPSECVVISQINQIFLSSIQNIIASGPLVLISLTLTSSTLS